MKYTRKRSKPGWCFTPTATDPIAQLDELQTDLNIYIDQLANWKLGKGGWQMTASQQRIAKHRLETWLGRYLTASEKAILAAAIDAGQHIDVKRKDISLDKFHAPPEVEYSIRKNGNLIYRKTAETRPAFIR